MMRLEDDVAVDDFLCGANFMSASGGGDPVEQRRLLLDDLARGLEVGWSPVDADADDLLCTACFSGSIAPGTFERPPVVSTLAPGERIQRPIVEAVRELEDYLGRPVAGLVSVEIGGINTGAILDAAANLGKTLVDGDYAGRAIPELQATTPHLYGVQVLPWALCDEFGNRLVIRGAASNAFAERIGKFLAQASFGLIGCALVPLPACEVARILVPGTLSECLRLGQAIRAARAGGADPVRVAADALDGWVLFKGVICRREWSDTGYMEGFHEIEGDGDFQGHTLKVWFKNENHVTWLDGEPYVCSPDLVEVCRPDTAEPLVNTYLQLGDRVAVVGRRRRAAFDSETGVAALGPRHFGWDLDFTPIERLAAAR
ncbi:MAG TPA: DUF917 domain-containing protein [Actinomycetes bacterium]|jgi:DUF917 family protein|nr:DUF917 domain-containing protein [Actinomycetes bacterium]